jgi:transposase-like protein
MEKVRWGGKPVCPYKPCGSTNSSPMPLELRHHCNTCNTSYSVTVNTLFHKTQLDYQKWFYCLWKVLNHKEQISYRTLGKEMDVTKDTASYMVRRIGKAIGGDSIFLKRLVDANDFYSYGGI